MKRAFYLSAFAALLLANVAGWAPCCCLFGSTPADTAAECSRCLAQAMPAQAAVLNTPDACCQCLTLTTAPSENTATLTAPAMTLAAVPAQPDRVIPQIAGASNPPPQYSPPKVARPLFLLCSTLLI